MYKTSKKLIIILLCSLVSVFKVSGATVLFRVYKRGWIAWKTSEKKRLAFLY